MAVTKLVSGIKVGSAVCVLADGTIVVASVGGTITHYDATGAELASASVGRAVGSLAAHPADDGVLATSGNALHHVRFGAAPSVTKLRSIGGARGLAVDAATGTVLVTSSTSGRLLRVSLTSPAAPTVVASGLVSPIGVATRAGASHAYVLAKANGVATVFDVDVAGASAASPVASVGVARDMAWTDTAGTQIAAGDGGSIVIADVADPATPPVVLQSGLKRVWGLDCIAGSSVLLVGSGASLLLVDLPAAPAVILEMPTAPMYLSSWARIGVAAHGVAFDDLVFRVDPPEGGLVSHAKDATFDKRPSVVLAASAIVGDYAVVAHDRNTGDTLAVGKFEVTDLWSGVDGPSASYVGTVGTDAPDPAWGGGDPFVPQNLSVTPVLGDRRVAVVLAETADIAALGNAGQAALRTAWQNEVFDGVMRGGVLESARRYWRDVSGNQMDLVNAGVIGPIRLANNWASYGTSINATSGQTDGWEAFARAVVADIRAQNEAAAAAGQPPVLDLMTVDSIVLVIRSLPASGTNPGRFVWPSATRPGAYQLTFEVARQTVSIPIFPWGSFDVTLPISRTIQMFSMPDDWETRDTSGRVRGETVAHELGHNFGLPDEYARSSHPQASKDRDLAQSTTAGASWSVMSWEEQFPQPTVVEKMMLGWVQPAHVRNLSFATLGPVDEEIRLHASDLGAPPAGRHSVAEVRIADGRNYYFEYRRERPTTLKDQDVPVDRTVVGIDCVSGMEPSDRRNILRIRDDSDADKAEFQQGDDYEETDTSSAAYPNDFKMDVLETAADFARIHITYGDAKPDPQIRPWAPSTNWKSPDLRVTNARNLADNAFRDIPWEGHDNRIVATVRNPGQIDAVNVRVNFFVRDFTLGGGAETALGSDTHDVDSGATVEFTSSVPWIPPPLSAIPFLDIDAHYCVVARIEEYSDPNNPAIREITLDNNEAQSNHTQLISVSASPSTRETGVVKVTNPLAVAADCRVVVRQTSPFFRTYLEHTWVHLQSGEERNVTFMSESLVGDPVLTPIVREYRDRIYREPNSLRLTGIADDHLTCHGFVTGGAHVLVRAARKTRFVKFSRDGGLASGRIEAVDDGQGVNGTVLVTMTPPDAPEDEVVRAGTVSNGDFRIELGRVRRGWIVQGHYTGRFDLGPCESERLKG